MLNESSFLVRQRCTRGLPGCSRAKRQCGQKKRRYELFDLSRRIPRDEYIPREWIRHFLLQHRIAQRECVGALAMLTCTASAHREWHRAILVWRLRNLWQRLRTMPRHHPAQTTERVYELRCVRILPRQTIERFERRVMLRRDDEHLDAVGERCRPLQCFDEMRRRARGTFNECVDQ